MELVTVEGPNTNQNVRTPSIWGRCPFDQILNGQVGGVALYEDFSTWNKTPGTTEGNWTGTTGWAQFTSGTATLTAIAPTATTKAGIPSRGITIGTADDNGIHAYRAMSNGFMLNRANQKLYFEICLKKSSVANTILEFAAGFIETVAFDATHPFTTTAATMSDNNMVILHSTESNGDAGNTEYTANGVTAVVVGTDELTFVADTFTKIGMKFEPRGDKFGAYTLSFYQDGTRLSSAKIIPDSNGTDFPTDVAMQPFFGIRNAAGSSPGTVSVKWLAAAQLYAPLS